MQSMEFAKEERKKGKEDASKVCLVLGNDIGVPPCGGLWVARASVGAG